VCTGNAPAIVPQRRIKATVRPKTKKGNSYTLQLMRCSAYLFQGAR